MIFGAPLMLRFRYVAYARVYSQKLLQKCIDEMSLIPHHGRLVLGCDWYVSALTIAFTAPYMRQDFVICNDGSRKNDHWHGLNHFPLLEVVDIPACIKWRVIKFFIWDRWVSIPLINKRRIGGPAGNQRGRHCLTYRHTYLKIISLYSLYSFIYYLYYLFYYTQTLRWRKRESGWKTSETLQNPK